MSFVIVFMILFSVISAFFCGKMPQLSAGAMSGCKQAVELTITIAGTIALWSGIMAVAEKSGVTLALNKIMLPITKGLLFRRLMPEGAAMKAISMNITANLMGLGNAATPLGIAAMGEMEKEAGYPEKATPEMITFVAINTASLQIIPTTTAFLRLQAGSRSPMEILIPVWISSLAAVIVAVAIAKGVHSRCPTGLSR